MKYIKSANEEYILDDGENINDLGKCKLDEAKKAAEKLVKPGATNHEVYAAACEVLERYGVCEYFTHALGHGVGLDIHEGTNMTDKGPEVTLQKNEIVTIEPGVYFPGEFGIRLEDEIVVQ